MRFNKKKFGLFLLFLLLLITTSISFITFNPKNKTFKDKSVFLSAPEDPYEQNDNRASACDITFLEANWISNYLGNGTQGDDDWYMIDIDPGEERLRVVLLFNDSAGNIDIEVYDSNDNYIDGNYSTNDNEILERDIYPAGVYFLRVFGDNQNNTYDLWWEDRIPIDDRFEENDYWGGARPIVPDYHSNLKIVYDDEDWFNVYLNYGDIIDVSIFFYYGDGNLELELYDPSYSLRTGSYSSGSNEYIYFTSDYTGNWRIRIYHLYANSEVYYDMDIRVDDSYEENDDFYNAWYLDPNYYFDLRMNYGDEDWFSIYLNPGESIDVSIYFNDTLGDLELELFDPYNSYRTGSYSSNDNEYIYFTADFSGDWRIRVYHADATTHTLYNMDIWVYGGDDWAEENDDFWSAYYLDPGYHSGLMIQQGDEDWFSVYFNAGDTIDISIYFNYYDGDLELELYDPNYNYQTGSYSSDNDEFIYYTTTMSGQWRIRVYHAYADSEVYYDLDIWVNRGDDWMEENDDYWSARWIDPNYYPNLLIIEGDDDWFRVYLNDGDTIEIRIYFINWDGNLQLELYGPNNPNDFRKESYSNEDEEYIFYEADTSGDWRFRIFHESADSRVSYSLELWINGQMGGDDPYEHNNNYDIAYDLHDDEHIWLSQIHGLAVQGDDDWYMIDVTPGFQHLIVNLKFNRSLGNINVDIYRLEGPYGLAWVTANYSLTGEDWIDINITQINWGVYFIQVHGGDSQVEYDLWWDDLRTENRLDDNYEINNDIATAYDLTFHQNEELIWINDTAIQRDNDWYKIRVPSGREHLIVLLKYDYQEGAIGIEVYDWAGLQVVSNFSMEDNEIISYDVPSNGTYYIRIFGDRTGNTYSLSWHTSEPFIEEIPGYDIFILLGAIFGVGVVITLKWKRSKK